MASNGRPCKLTLQKILEGIQDTGGIRTEICRKLNISYQTLYNYMKRYPKIKEALTEEEEKVLDMAEGNLFGLIQNGDTSAIFYFLNNKGRGRGYGQPYKTTIIDKDEGEQKKTGVLVTPGILTDNTWEEAAKQTVEEKQTKTAEETCQTQAQ